MRKEAEMMLATAIEERDKEALSAAVALATQLRLRTPQVHFLLYHVFVLPYPTPEPVHLYHWTGLVSINPIISCGSGVYLPT